ncbi:MAG: mono/diheme cytochrome c family protein, partial [Verrucomicrobiales bacterium]
MTSTLSAISRPWAFLATLVVCALTTAESAELAGPIEQLLAERCIDCHDSETKKGGVDLEELMANFDPRTDVDPWVKVESAIAKAKMPPPKKKPLEAAQVAVFGNWFETEFVTPGGVQHAGPNHPRRLTREELQNTLEDILHLDLRETVTNSRLHVIPDTVIEKFFAAGVYGASGFSNDAVTLSAESIDVQTYARCFSLVLGRLDSDEEARKRLFGTATLPEKIPLTEARKIIDAFGRAAFRRPLSTEESAAFAEVYQQLLAKRTSAEAIKSSMLAILLSPPFFYRFEEPAEGQTPVVGEELAVRLSYFLWSAPPDGILLDLAAKGELRNPEVLQQQVRRMLADPKRIALAENLGGEWFDYKKLRQQSAINKRSDQMAGFYRTQYEEALLFFDSLIRYDQSVFDLVGADWTFINPHTSRIYRLATAEKSFTEDNALPPINLHYRAADRQIAQGNYEYKHIPLTLVGLGDADRGG